MRKSVFCVKVALLMASAGCNTHNIYPVSGKVTYKGAPATGAVVVFQRQGDPIIDPVIMSIVQEDGTFELVCGSLGKGAPPGEYTVVIEWKQASQGNKGRPKHGPDKLKGHYADPKHPRLHAVVKAEANQLPPIELQD